jgi:hypothetical protein
MKPEEAISLVSIIAFGCDNYDNLPHLYKVREDLDRVRNVFCKSDYSIFKEENYHEIYDKTSGELREEIQNYLFTRSAEQDILILYFSGHGTAIGREDFGFCMKDAEIHPEERVILPTSVVKLSELIGTLSIKNVSVILFVDSCYSGQISKSLNIKPIEISKEMGTEFVSSYGSSFGLITSCTDVQQTLDLGIISQALKDICEQGISEINSPYLVFGDLSNSLYERIDRVGKGDSNSRVIIPSGAISNIPFCKNIQYVEPEEQKIIYSFTNPYLNLLDVLWNDGNPISLSKKEILEKTNSASAYANHNKLSLPPWNLLETKEGKRQLTERGLEFISGKIKIPKSVTEYKNTGICEATKGSPSIQVVREKNLLNEMEIKIIEC